MHTTSWIPSVLDAVRVCKGLGRRRNFQRRIHVACLVLSWLIHARAVVLLRNLNADTLRLVTVGVDDVTH